MTAESAILAAVRIAMSKAGVLIWRNNSGVLPDRNGRPVRFGVASPGGSDLIGWQTRLITPAMVGTRVAVFVACEVKAEDGRPTTQQRHFLDTVAQAGGIAILAHSAAEAVEGLSQGR